MDSIKIEILNQSVSQAIPGKAAAGTAHVDVSDVSIPASRVDRINLSIPNIQSDKNLSTLISNLLDALNEGTGLTPAQEGQQQEINFLKSLFYKGEEPLLFLKGFIEKSGLLYEAKIAKGDIEAPENDLKGLLLRFLEKSGTKPEGGKAALALLNDIESRQLLNVKAKDDGALYLQLPIMLPNGPSTAEVYVKRDGKEKGRYKGDCYRVGFSIELRDAGFLTVDALVNRDNVSIRLQAEKAPFLEFMKSHLPELSERLSNYGTGVRLSN